jgi:hypothetical protein
MRRGIDFANLGFFVLCILLFVTAFGQQTPTVRNAVPESELFLMLFRSIAPSGLSPNPQMSARPNSMAIRSFQSSAQLSDEQAQKVVEAAIACVSKVTEVDRKAREVNLAAREQAKKNGTTPVPPPEIRELQKQRDGIIDQELSRLRIALGDAAYDRLAYAISHQNVNQRGEERASMSVSIPPDLALPAPPESRIVRPDFIVPRESLYESKLPVKMMITPVGPEGAAEKLQFRVGEEIYFKVTLLNALPARQALHVAEILKNYQVDGTQNGMKLPGPVLWVTLSLIPSLANSPIVDIPYNVPLVIGILHLEKRPQLKMAEGKYTFVLHRDFALRPTINKEEEALYEEIGHFALKSNTVAITILPATGSTGR